MSLERFRQWAGTLPAKIILGFLALGLAVFAGMNDILRNPFGGGAVGTVGSKELSTITFSQRLYELVRTAERSTGKRLTPEDIFQLRLPGTVLRQMVQHTLLDLEVERLQLAVTDAQVRQAIQTNPAFQDEKGSFDPRRFQGFLQANHMREDVYVALLRGELRRNQLIGALAAPIQPLALGSTLVSKAKHQQRQGSYTFIPADKQKQKIVPGDETLRAFHRRFERSFVRQEIRNVTVLFLNKDAAFRHFPQESQETALQRLGKEVDDALGSGETLEEVAQKFKLSPISLLGLNANGVLTQGNWPQQLSLTDQGKATIVDQAFKAELKEDTPLSWVGADQAFVLRVDGISPEKTLPFEQVRETVLEKWKLLHRYELAVQEGVALADRLREDPAQLTLLSWNTLPWVSFQHLEKQANQDHKGESAALKEALFEMAVGDFRVVPDRDGAYVLRLLQIKQTEANQQQEALSNPTAEAFKEDVLQSYIQSLRNRYMVQINDNVIQRVVMGMAR